MNLSRAGVRTIFVAAAVAAGVILSGRAAQADCGRSAANDARPAYRDVEAHPPTTATEARSSRARLAEYTVLPCPDGPPSAREADYRVFIAWRRALDARSDDVVYGETYPDARCAPVRRAMQRAAIAEAFHGAFTRAFAETRASPDALHVDDLLRREGRSVGLVLPPPWTVRNVAHPVSMEPFAVRAHLPRGVACGI